ncbi:GNAT family N-acetyltransferase [Tatumella morbirosei]|uniref:GNAT family N-acetyltransferase n=1 Tax=Tatumella morbirosei TaxID=642227 RepID=UPI00062A0BEE|nr:GNAT family N-acetyltransferase [Tatumella morbirosei]
MKIRHANVEDCEAIAGIYNHAVVHSAAIWTDHTVDGEERKSWMVQRQQAGYPVIVITDEQDKVAGYASYGEWSAKEGYRFTVEHSVYVRHDFRGNGAGRLLMNELISLAVAQGLHVMVAAIESGNLASIALHQSLGFTGEVRIPEVGTKFGRWLDLTFLYLPLEPLRATSASGDS